MSEGVPVEVPSLSEGGRAFVADEKPFGGVRQDMPVQVSLSFKGNGAVPADERQLAISTRAGEIVRMGSPTLPDFIREKIHQSHVK